MTPEYLAKPLAPYPLPTKDGWMLRTINDARAYILALPKKRLRRGHWRRARQLLMKGCGHPAGSPCVVEGRRA